MDEKAGKIIEGGGNGVLPPSTISWRGEFFHYKMIRINNKQILLKINVFYNKYFQENDSNYTCLYNNNRKGTW